jgi:type VI secretion system secreted protein VgrG
VANFKAICDWVLRLEDSTLSGKVVNLFDGQGLTRFGIAQHAHPQLPEVFYTMDPIHALPIAESIYKAEYWDKFCGDDITDDGVASCLLSFSINDGEQREVMTLQQVLGFTKTDGLMGPITLAATNNAGPALAPKLRQAQANFYRMLVQKQPTDARFLDGWLRRAALIYPNL